MKRAMIAAMVVLMALVFPAAALAGVQEIGKGPSIGFQYFAPASGVSLRLPVGYGVVLQPIVGMAMHAKGDEVSGGLALAGRLLYTFDRPDWQLVPYAGLGAGFEQKHITVDGNPTLKNTQGYQVFFGAEYRRFRLSPTLEYGLGYSESDDGKYFAGSFINAGLHYYF